ncbi:MAG: hypothetical protein Fur006_65760 [Coleofasciculaceae cyanobacterium]
MRQVKTKISEGGRVVIPAEYRKQLGLEVGDEVIVRLVDGEIRIFTLAQAIQRAQAWVRSFTPEGKSLVDELIAERRQESQCE